MSLESWRQLKVSFPDTVMTLPFRSTLLGVLTLPQAVLRDYQRQAVSADLKAGAEKAGFNASAYKRAAKLMELRNIGTYHDPIMELPDSWSPSAQADD